MLLFLVWWKLVGAVGVRFFLRLLVFSGLCLLFSEKKYFKALDQYSMSLRLSILLATVLIALDYTLIETYPTKTQKP